MATALAGCGFELRREPELSFKTLALTGFAECLLDYRDRTVVASTSVGQVREFQLRLQFDYLIRTASGELLVPKVELRLSRDMNYTETTALAKEQEAANLYGAMHSDAIAQVMRRLAAVKLQN
jgi:LPS-assembly lipoprotein